MGVGRFVFVFGGVGGSNWDFKKMLLYFLFLKSHFTRFHIMYKYITHHGGHHNHQILATAIVWLSIVMIQVVFHLSIVAVMVAVLVGLVP